jgi:hypothetical protein
MSLSRLVFGIFIIAVLSVPLNAFAQEKRLEMVFDKSFICCLANHSIIAEKLEEVDGISTAHFILKKRKVLVYYDPSKIKIPSIVERLSKITLIDKKYIVAEVQ